MREVTLDAPFAVLINLLCAYQPALCLSTCAVLINLRLSNCIPAGITSPMPVLRLQFAEVASRAARSYVRSYVRFFANAMKLRTLPAALEVPTGLRLSLSRL